MVIVRFDKFWMSFAQYSSLLCYFLLFMTTERSRRVITYTKSLAFHSSSNSPASSNYLLSLGFNLSNHRIDSPGSEPGGYSLRVWLDFGFESVFREFLEVGVHLKEFKGV